MWQLRDARSLISVSLSKAPRTERLWESSVLKGRSVRYNIEWCHEPSCPRRRVLVAGHGWLKVPLSPRDYFLDFTSIMQSFEGGYVMLSEVGFAPD